MTDVPLPIGIVGVDNIPKRQEYLVNLYNPADNTLLHTPGVDSFGTGTGTCRGSVTFQEDSYQVSGSKLIKIAPGGGVTIIGTITGTADCEFAQSFIALIIIVKGGDGFVLSTTEILTPIIDTDFKPSIEVEAIDARFVFVPFDGGPLFYTDVNDPDDIPSLNFFDAELLPDKNTGLINVRNDLYVMGVESTEVFRTTSDPDNAFIRRAGAAVETGYVGGKARYKDTFLFLGRDREGSFAFHGMGTGDAPKISNPAIDQMLNEDFTETELKAVTSTRFTFNGIDFVAFRLSTVTFLYYGSGWSYIQSGITDDDVFAPWTVNHMSFAYGKYVVGDAGSSRIGQLSKSNKEYGDDVQRIIDTLIKAGRDTFYTLDSLTLDVTTGTDTEGTVGLRISKDGRTRGPIIWRNLGKTGSYQRRMIWQGGIGTFESFCGITLRTTADVNFSTDGLIVNG